MPRILLLSLLLIASAAAFAATDPTAATEAFMQRLTPDARARSDAYFEGKTWLILWELTVTLLISWLLLSSRVSARIREFAERRARGRNLQALIYVLAYVPLTTLLALPLAIYAGWWREHQYGLSNLGLAAWLGEQGITLVVDTILGAIAFTVLYLILRKLPRTWWAWGTLAGGIFVVLMIMVAPVFISPLFNTYKPLPEGQLRDEILAMARANGVPADNVYWFDASKQSKRISANVSGMFGTTRISLNDNLLNRTSPAEIRAVMAHELGHYVLNHGIKHVVSFTLLLLGGMLFIRATWTFAFSRWGARCGVRGLDDPAGLPLLAAIFAVYLFLATPVFNTIIRTAETEADLFGLNAAREPDGFAEAIFKLGEYRKLHPGAFEEFMFFDHPSGYNRIYAAMRWKAEQRK